MLWLRNVQKYIAKQRSASSYVTNGIFFEIRGADIGLDLDYSFSWHSTILATVRIHGRKETSLTFCFLQRIIHYDSLNRTNNHKNLTIMYE